MISSFVLSVRRYPRIFFYLPTLFTLILSILCISLYASLSTHIRPELSLIQDDLSVMVRLLEERKQQIRDMKREKIVSQKRLKELRVNVSGVDAKLEALSKIMQKEEEEDNKSRRGAEFAEEKKNEIPTAASSTLPLSELTVMGQDGPVQSVCVSETTETTRTEEDMETPMEFWGRVTGGAVAKHDIECSNELG